MSVHGEV